MKRVAWWCSAAVALLTPVLVAADSLSAAQKRFDRGYAAYCKGDYDAAISLWTEALRLDPRHVPALLQRGTAYLLLHDPDRSITDFSEAVRLRPVEAWVYLNRAAAFTDKRDYQRALDDIAEVLWREPDNYCAYFNRGTVHAGMQDFGAAIKDFTEALRVQPGDSASYCKRGDAWAAKGDYSRAEADYRKAIVAQPEFSGGYEHLAKLLATCPDPGHRDGPKAVESARKACELAARWRTSPPYAVLAAAYAEAGDFRQAIRWQEKALAAQAERLRRQKQGKPDWGQ